ncbi:hypothetical protein CBS9595_004089 [Malassezia furfur]|nr:hypothetical protein CBS9595_004089 [Malassezia furfur]
MPASSRPRSALARLRAMAEQGGARRAGAQRTQDGDEVLTWDGAALACTRGAAVVRRWRFAEPIRAACAARLGRDGGAPERAVCVVLERTAHVFFARCGEAYVVPLPFRVAAAFAVLHGVLLVEDAPGARVHYVRGVLDDLAPWAWVEAIDGAPHAPTLHGALRPFPSAAPLETVVWASAAHALLVTASRHALRFYVYACAAQPMPHDAAAPEPAAAPVRTARRASVRRTSRRHSAHAARDADWHVLAELAQPHASDARAAPPDALLDRRASLSRRVRARKSSLPAADRETSDAVAHAPAADEPFAGFAQAHAAAALVDHVALDTPLADADVARVVCTPFCTRGATYVYVAVPPGRVYVRAVHGEAHAPRVGAPPPGVAAALDAHAVHPVALACAPPAADALLVTGAASCAHVHCGAPGTDTAALAVAPDTAPAALRVRPTCRTAQRVLDVAVATLPPARASALLAAWAAACGVARGARQLGTWSTLARLAGVGAPANGSGAYVAMCAAAPRDAFLDAVLGAPPAAAWDAAPLGVDAPSLALVLHFVALDAQADVYRRATELPRVVRLLQRVCGRLGWATWCDFWARRCGDPDAAAGGAEAAEAAAAGAAGVAEEAAPAGAAGPAPPPDLYALVGDSLHTPTSLDAAYAACAASVGVAPVAPLAPHCAWLAALLAVYAALRPVDGAGAVAQRVVEAMLAVHWDATHVARLPPGLALPLHEALRTCQLDPPRAWPAAAYALVQRLDAAAQAGGAHAAGRVRVAPALLRTLPDGLDPLSAQLFAHDYRLAEVARMLQTTHANVAHVAPDDERDEAEHHAELVHTARTLAERTMAQCVGRGAFRMASRAVRATATWRTPRLQLALRALPGGAVVAHPYAADPHEVDWPEFHNGVASALEMALHADDRLDSSWIFSHSTAPRDAARHAGFLLGLGLQGHLARLGRVHAYRYLAPRHALTTVGLVLGVAASFRGTADPAARQVMAVQAAAFLPARGAALHLPALTQAAGVLGMGLVFAATDHRWTAERLAAQLDAPLAAPDAAHAHDLYANAAGLALGFVLLGRGRRTPMDAASDAALVARLRRLVGAHAPEAPAANRAAHAATLALGLVFLRSARADVARLVAPPPSRAALAQTRPDLLLVRAVAHALIHWDAIAPDDAWLLSTLPPFLQTLAPHTALAPAERVAWYNARAGACLALALRFAGSAEARARAVLLRQLHTHVDDATPAHAPATYAHRIVHAARETLRDVLHVALAMVMAGTGDVELLRIYRTAHGAVQRGYGSQMAAHTALGLLFLGGGRWTLGTDDVAVAALLAAFLPRFPASPGDHRAHLQAARHLYVLALAPRLLVARDVRSGEACALPITTDGAARVHRVAPTLLPPRGAVHAVHSASRRYWPASLGAAQLGAAAADADARAPLVFHVQRRTGYRSYVEDPRGHRSIFARARGWGAHPLRAPTRAEAHALRRDLAELVQGFATAPHDAALARRVCAGDAPFATFATAALLTCLTADTRALARVYGALHAARAAPDALAVADARFLGTWAASAACAMLTAAREPLLPRATRAAVAAQVVRLRGAALPADAAAYLAAAAADAPRLSRAGALALAQLGAPPYAALRTLRAHYVRAPPALGAAVLRRLYPRDPALVAHLVAVWSSS